MPNNQTRIASIDYGQARIGIAVSDPSKIIATPLTTVSAEKKLEETTLKVIATLKKYEEEGRCQIEKIVVGLPLLMNGKKGLSADEVLHFVELLKKQTDIPIITWDERLTTVQAERSLREGNLSRKKRTAHVDKIAAVLILQNFLDSRIGLP